MKSPASFSTDCLRPGPILVPDAALEDVEHQLEVNVDMGIGHTPGGIVATFIESFEAPTFLALKPTRYWMLFQLRQLPPPRITEIPSPPSTSRPEVDLRASSIDRHRSRSSNAGPPRISHERIETIEHDPAFQRRTRRPIVIGERLSS